MTNLDEKKLQQFWIDGFKIGPDESVCQSVLVATIPNMVKIPGQKRIHVIEFAAFADQQKKIEKLEKAVELMRTQVDGLILCLKTHGTNINDLFLIDHYKKTLAKVDSILKEGE